MDSRSGAADGAPLTRRAVLTGAASTVALGAAGTAAAQEAELQQVPDYGGWFSGDARGSSTTSFTGTVDRRGEDAVTIEVGASGNGGPYAYAPTAVWVDPGTEITFEWTSDTHNVVVESQPDGAGWSGHESVEDGGFSFSQTFETGGIYTYFCQPHLSLGMKGAIAVGDDVPTTSPGGESGGFAFPAGDLGVSFMGLLFGTAGLAAAIVLAGELHGTVKGDGDGPTSAYTTALVAATIGLVALVAVVARLLIG